MHSSKCSATLFRKRQRKRLSFHQEDGGRSGGEQPSVRPPSSFFLDALKACGVCRDIGSAKKLHYDAIECGIQHHVFVATAIITMYARCGCMDSSRRVFDRMPRPDVVAWTALVTGYVINDDSEQALGLLPRIQQQQLGGDPRILVALLTACSKLAAVSTDGACLDTGMMIHSLAAGSKLDSAEMFVGSAVVDMYIKGGSLLDARMVFDRMDRHDVVAWTSLLLGYANSSDEQDVELSLSLFHSMLEVCHPSAHTFVAVLMACAGLAGNRNEQAWKLSILDRTREIHAVAREFQVEQEVFVATALVDVYAKCGSMEDARRVFETMPCHNIVVLNSLLLGYVEKGDADVALSIFSSSRQSLAWSPNHRTLVVALMACSSIGHKGNAAIDQGMEIHGGAAKLGLDTSDLFIGSTLVDMYASCGSLYDARLAFDRMVVHNVVCWTSLLLAYAENGEPELALELFESMVSTSGIRPNSKTFRVALSACANFVVQDECPKSSSSKLLERVRKIHRQAMELGHDGDIFVANTLIHVYAKCGGLSDAKVAFESIQHQRRTAVSWHAMMLGLVENEHYQQALDLWEEMLQSGTSFSCLTIVAALMASSGLANLNSGRQLHSLACRHGFESDASVATSLIDFYGKCGSSTIVASHIFDSCPTATLPHWNALIAGHSRHGDSSRVFSLFRQLQDEGLHPDSATFLPILAACSHAGLVDRGTQLLETMVVPGLAHYTCVIDMLGRSNRLRQAVEMIERLPRRADAAVWTSVLAASRKWENIEVAKLAFNKVLELDGNKASPYLLMASVYGDSRSSVCNT